MKRRAWVRWVCSVVVGFVAARLQWRRQPSGYTFKGVSTESVTWQDPVAGTWTIGPLESADIKGTAILHEKGVTIVTVKPDGRFEVE